MGAQAELSVRPGQLSLIAAARSTGPLTGPYISCFQCLGQRVDHLFLVRHLAHMLWPAGCGHGMHSMAASASSGPSMACDLQVSALSVRRLQHARLATHYFSTQGCPPVFIVEVLSAACLANNGTQLCGCATATAAQRGCTRDGAFVPLTRSGLAFKTWLQNWFLKWALSLSSTSARAWCPKMPPVLKSLLLALALFNLRACSSQAMPLACMSGLTTLEVRAKQLRPADIDDAPIHQNLLSTVPVMQAVARCLRQFMLPEGSIPASQWEGRNVLLDADQAARVRRLVHGMLQQLHEQPQQPQHSMASGESTVPPPHTCHAALAQAGLTDDALKSWGLSLQAFVDRQLQQPYCVLLETELADGQFSKGWGYFITPAGAAASLAPSTTGRSISSAGSYQAALDPPQLDGLAAASKRQLPLHIACPHPLFDGRDIDVQAVHLFKASGARSVVVAGHHRLASNRSSR